jgi:effector-binding domain-containing protein
VTYDVRIDTVQPERIAAVRAAWTRETLPSVIVASLDQVYEFLNGQPQLPRGHNVIIYHSRSELEAGVQVSAAFSGAGAVQPSATPGGRVARTLHRGPYSRIGDANDAVHAWCRENGHRISGPSWEVYGDWAENEADLETEIFWQFSDS